MIAMCAKQLSDSTRLVVMIDVKLFLLPTKSTLSTLLRDHLLVLRHCKAILGLDVPSPAFSVANIHL